MDCYFHEPYLRSLLLSAFISPVPPVGQVLSYAFKKGRPTSAIFTGSSSNPVKIKGEIEGRPGVVGSTVTNSPFCGLALALICQRRIGFVPHSDKIFPEQISGSHLTGKTNNLWAMPIGFFMALQSLFFPQFRNEQIPLLPVFSITETMPHSWVYLRLKVVPYSLYPHRLLQYHTIFAPGA